MSSQNSQLRHELSVKGLNHTLHLYTSKVDKYAIQKAFLIHSNQQNEKVVYVTADDATSLIQEFSSTNADLKIVKPEELKNLDIEENCKPRIILDAGSILHQKGSEIEQRESYLGELCKKYSMNCLCTYEVAKLNSKIIKKLTRFHNQLQLTTSDLTILSGDLFDRSKLSANSIEKMVKDNLETIILALLQKKPMCGTEIMGTLHMEFNVLLSPGTIYPLLHSLKEKGLLMAKKQGKAKEYAAAEDAKLKITTMVNEHIEARKLLNHYLQQESVIQRKP